MFLKSLEIRGFKSFADKTELKFKKGVTAVVGPNGSGKSNISDAVRWVLGEQSVKVLRGGKMEDVIFSGTQFRKPVGLAQVSLTLDNSDGKLDTEYNEVTVSRRIYRSGESEYLINNLKCRLKDVTDLFLDTGIGKEGYSLIGQGKIEAILSGKKEDKRALLEEAAGIVKYKNRKEEAEKKLSNTDENIIRINDIMSTYEERLEPLRIEKEKALKFNELSNELKNREISITVHKISIMENEIKSFDDKLQEKYLESSKLKEVYLNKKQYLKELEEKTNELEKNNIDKKEKYYNLRDKITESKNNIEIYNERIKNSNEKIIKNENEQENYKLKKEELLKQKEKLNEALNEIKKNQFLVDEKIKSVKDKKDIKEKEYEKLKQKLDLLKSNQFDFIKKNSDIKNGILFIENSIKVNEEKISELSSSIESVKNNISINRGTYNELATLSEEMDKNINENQKLMNQKKKEISESKANLINIEKTFRKISDDLTKSKTNKDILINLEKHYEGYARSAKSLMEAVDRKHIVDRKSINLVGSIFKADEKYETAIEIALGQSMSNIVTDNENTAKVLIEYLKRNRLGRATFLPINTIKSYKISVNDNIKIQDGYIGIASDIISFDPKYRNIMDYILGKTLVIRDMDSALKIAKMCGYRFNMVTLDGEVIRRGGALTGGSIRGQKLNVLGRKREIEELDKNIVNLKDKVSEISEEIKNKQIEIKDQDDCILDIRDEIHKISIKFTKKQSEMQGIKNYNEKLKENLNKLLFDIKKVRNKKEEFESELKKKNEIIKDLESENITNLDEVNLVNEQIENKEKDIKENENKITDLRIEKAKTDELLQSKNNGIIRTENDLTELYINLEKSSDELNFSKNEIENINKLIKESEIFIENADKEIEKYDDLFRENEIKKAKLKEEFQEKDEQMSEISYKSDKLSEIINKNEIIKAKKETEKEHIYKKLNEDLKLTFKEASDIAENITDESKIESEISSLKIKINKLGTVNLSSISEYDEIKEKYEFMKNQSDDLLKAKMELIKVIDEMTSTMKKMFKANFKILNRNFNETFIELFKGGSAELILGQGDELSCDININVEPPGKKLQNINLMSGGEKVLSAIALVFAILKMKPTPFCILDEIEAALDDANVYKYAEFLKKFSENTQFIVITHRKGTMEAGDIIYGVTMQEKGISKVVSVDISKY
ncbi:chromosome segregation protein SMC [Clostridium sp. BJN0001]|uniref:chromosome segregation protein SMC n=1 Tax=Clostridium sp. BJN0001 TaxID=2930219 RepID=UPI001FD29FFA|nr:chromosome segregation protein SMC [Clostridium sp. BJN0001]